MVMANCLETGMPRKTVLYGTVLALFSTPALAAGPEGFADIAEGASPAVVTVLTEGGSAEAVPMDQFGPNGPNREFFERFFGERGTPFAMPDRDQPRNGLGSGFIIDEDGIIVTNNHVIDGADQITVVLEDGRRLDATLVGADEKTDLAVLEVEATVDLPTIEFGDTEELRVGDWVVALGNPFGIGATVTAGIVSALSRDIRSGPYDDYIQVDAPINRGNSGGPLLDGDGDVIGVNTAIFSPSGGSVGIGFAIPAELAERVVADLLDDGQVDRGWIGVSIQTVTPDIAESLGLEMAEGALVANVLPDSPAEAADLMVGDVILSFGDTDIDSLRDLTRAVADEAAGTDVEVSVWRNGSDLTLNLEVGQLEEDQIAGLVEPANDDTPSTLASLGLQVTELEGTVVVADVAPTGPAFRQGIQQGDVISRVGTEKVDSVKDLIDGLDSAKAEGDTNLLILVERDGNARFLTFDLTVS